jgi:hypothetical protein
VARHTRGQRGGGKPEKEIDLQLRPFCYPFEQNMGNTRRAVEAAPGYPSASGRKPLLGDLSGLLRDGVVAGLVAGVLSGAPSTLHAAVTGTDPLAAARAAGNLLLPDGARPAALLAAGAAAHVVLSVGWGTVVAMAARRSPFPPVVAGALTGAVVAAVDLGLLAHGRPGRRWPLIRALPVGPQVADHLAFGAVAGAVLARRG